MQSIISKFNVDNTDMYTNITCIPVLSGMHMKSYMIDQYITTHITFYSLYSNLNI